MANEMLSLLGSLQAEPFSAKHSVVKAHSEISRERSSSEDTFELIMSKAKRKPSRSQAKRKGK